MITLKQFIKQHIVTDPDFIADLANQISDNVIDSLIERMHDDVCEVVGNELEQRFPDIDEFDYHDNDIRDSVIQYLYDNLTITM